MVEERFVEQLLKRIGAAIPPGVNEMGAELRENVAAAVKGWLADMELVTREEFDIQTRLLERSNRKLRELEQRLDALDQAADDDT